MPDLSVLFNTVDEFFQRPEEDSRRIFHGRGGCYPGLQWCAIDAFAPTILITLYAPPPAALLTQIVEHVVRRLPSAGFDRLAIQHRYEPDCRYQWVVGQPLDHAFASRSGCRFHLRFSRQNLGFFLDMEPGRQWLEERAAGAKVLNLFAYTCAFSVVAQAAGAREVVNIDMSKSALATGRENHRLNGQRTDNIRFMPLDILKSWSRICKAGPYDIVIIDPPSFQKGSFVASRDYAKVARRLPQMLAPGAEVLACLNAPELTEGFLTGLFAENCPKLAYQQRLPMPREFCDTDGERQLKLLYFRHLK